ncbi:hypothetical protein C4588_02830 [Candidatus Parcubacteria bacterium]|nr:MAG: hypothetical protein C4588_02830 [Candidatus Parcubacteria bacterium]
MDLQFRQLARVAHDTDDINTRLQYLHIALRAGFLNEGHIYMSAIFGDPASRLLLNYTRQSFCSFLTAVNSETGSHYARPIHDVADIWSQEFYDNAEISFSSTIIVLVLIVMYRVIYVDNSKSNRISEMIYQHIVGLFNMALDSGSTHTNWPDADMQAAQVVHLALRARLEQGGGISLQIINLISIMLLNSEQAQNDVIRISRNTFTTMLNDTYRSPALGALSHQQICNKVSQDMIRGLLFEDDILTI